MPIFLHQNRGIMLGAILGLFFPITLQASNNNLHQAKPSQSSTTTLAQTSKGIPSFWKTADPVSIVRKTSIAIGAPLNFCSLQFGKITNANSKTTNGAAGTNATNSLIIDKTLILDSEALKMLLVHESFHREQNNLLFLTILVAQPGITPPDPFSWCDYSKQGADGKTSIFWEKIKGMTPAIAKQVLEQYNRIRSNPEFHAFFEIDAYEREIRYLLKHGFNYSMPVVQQHLRAMNNYFEKVGKDGKYNIPPILNLRVVNRFNRLIDEYNRWIIESKIT